MKHTPSKTVGLSNSVHQRLNMYALAASAAGMGILSPQAAECKIVYTPAHITIGPNQIYSIDLQHNKVIDFRIFNDCRTVSGYRSAILLVDAVSPSTNALKGTTTSNGGNSAFRLQAGYLVGRGQHWDEFGAWMADYYRSYFHGKWQNGWHKAVRGYLGLMFKSKGNIHYGWARLTVDATYPCFTATLTGYAYETVANKAIIAGKTKGPDDAEATTPIMRAPEPVMLGALAMGAPGLSIWRRKESVLQGE